MDQQTEALRREKIVQNQAKAGSSNKTGAPSSSQGNRPYSNTSYRSMEEIQKWETINADKMRQLGFQKNTEQTSTEEPDSEASRFAQMQQAQQQSRMMMAGQAANQQSQSGDEAKKKVKGAVRQGVKRGILGLADMVGVAVDSSSVGITMIIDIFMYAFTLGWLNLDMLAYYKPYLRKDPIITPLDWSPIRVPLSPIWLHVGLVVVNLGVFCLVILAFGIIGLATLTLVAPYLILPGLITVGGLQILKLIGG